MSEHDYDQEERRESHKELKVMIQGLIDVLHTHMHDEEQDLKDMHAVLSKYFTDLDAQLHKTHHTWTGVRIEEEEIKQKFWATVKQNIITYFAIAAIGAGGMWLVHSAWEDLHTPHQPIVIGQAGVK